MYKKERELLSCISSDWLGIDKNYVKKDQYGKIIKQYPIDSFPYEEKIHFQSIQEMYHELKKQLGMEHTDIFY